MRLLTPIVLLLVCSRAGWCDDHRQEVWIAMNWSKDSACGLADSNTIIPAFTLSDHWTRGKIASWEYDEERRRKPQQDSVLNLRTPACKNARATITYSRFNCTSYCMEDLLKLQSAKPELNWSQPEERWGGWCLQERAMPIVFTTRPVKCTNVHPLKAEPGPPKKLCRTLDAYFEQDTTLSEEKEFSKPYSKYINKTTSEMLGKSKIYVVDIQKAPYDVEGEYWLVEKKDGEFALIGGGLALLLAGDFDKDGSIDAIFFEQDENEDGFLLAYAGLTQSVTYSWHYH